MKMSQIKFLLVEAMVCLSAMAWAVHSSEESNEIILSLLARAQRYANANLLSDEEAQYWQIVPENWQGFLMPDRSENWTLVERKSAFDSYLNGLSTNDCKKLSRREQGLIQTALVQCEIIGYTNSVPALRGLAFNSNGVYRSKAMELAIKFMQVSDETTCFVENVVTNHEIFSKQERATSFIEYEHVLRGTLNTNPVVSRSAQMFYRHRYDNGLAAVSCDLMLTSHLNGYEMSSNRLAHAMWALGLNEIKVDAQRYFTSVTNQVLSSCQPLRRIDVGGNE